MIDSRVHVCIYFISPTSYGLTESDITAMKNLCSRVNLIPVISKADTFTRDQIMKFKKLALLAIRENDIKICDMLSEESREEVNWDDFPFGVIGAENYAEKSPGEFVRARAYNWGIAEVENDSHCDFNLLKKLLLSTHMNSFIEGIEKHYEVYRTEMLKFRLQQLLKAQQSEDEEIPEEIAADLDDGAIEKIKLEEENRAVDLALKAESSFDYIKELSKVNSKSINEIFMEQNPVYLENQQQIKKNFASIVSAQEKKFKDWKEALIGKQKLFNREIQASHKVIVQLQKIIQDLEHELKGEEETDTIKEKPNSSLEDTGTAAI